MKILDVRAATIDELALTYTQVKQTIQGYEALGFDVPDTLTGLAKDIERESKERQRAQLEAELKRAQTRREAMMTADEKRAKLDERIKDLQAKLA